MGASSDRGVAYTAARCADGSFARRAVVTKLSVVVLQILGLWG